METSRITLLRRAFRSGSAEFWRGRVAGAFGFSRPVLVKRVVASQATDPRVVDQDRTEALLTARLDHPNVLTVLDYAMHEGQGVTVLEDAQVVDLMHLLERATVDKRKLPPRLALSIVWGVLQALEHAHRREDPSMGLAGIAHGDLSPANILIDVNGRVLVRDFGIPMQASPGGPLARLGRLHGKPGYMSPELVTRGVLGPRSDLFAVGILMFELLTFRRLFAGRDGIETLKNVALAQVDERIAKLGQDLSFAHRELMRRALKRQPEERWGSASEMLAALRASFPGSPLDAAAELAAFVAEYWPAEDEASDGAGAGAKRPRTGRRMSAQMLLLVGGGAEAAEAVVEAEDAWSSEVPPPLPELPEVEAMLAGIEPVGPPPLPPDAGGPPPLPER